MTLPVAGQGIDVAELRRRLGAAEDDEHSGGASVYVELFLDPDAPAGPDSPLLLFQHIPKTAGTSFRKVVRTNHRAIERVQAPSLRKESEEAISREALIEWHEQLWDRLEPAERSALRCVASHEANFLLPLVDRPATAVTLVRNPTERIVSRFFFTNRPSTDVKERRRDGTPNEGADSPRRWPLEKVYGEIGGKVPAALDRGLQFGQFFNGQARSILEPHFDTSELAFSSGPSDDADVWRERLFSIVDAHYFLGISERFEDFVELMARRYGWSEVFTPQLKVNSRRKPTAELPKPLVRTIADHNWLDVELYRRALERAGYDPDRPLKARTADPAARRPKKRLAKKVKAAARGEEEATGSKNGGRGARRLAKEHQRATKMSIKRGVALELYLAPEPLSAEEPVVVFQHIRKTGGTSVRQVIYASYAERARHQVLAAPYTYDPAELRDWSAGVLDSLGPDGRDALMCVAGHSANHFIPLLERPYRGLTMVREPLDWVMSRYHFTRKGSDERPFTLDELWRDPEALLERDDMREKVLRYYNGQSKALLAPHHDIRARELTVSLGPPENADEWRGRLITLLEEHYLVGVQERFDESLAAFAREFGWDDLAAPTAKVNQERPRELPDDELRARILEYNWLDRILYEHFASRPIVAGAASAA